MVAVTVTLPGAIDVAKPFGVTQRQLLSFTVKTGISAVLAGFKLISFLRSKDSLLLDDDSFF